MDVTRPLGWSEPGRTTHEITTGGWRTRRPVWVEAEAPCRSACPAGEPIPRWIERARAEDWAGAWRLVREENPLPAVTGRVCAHPCERSCNRGVWDGAVAVNALERFVGDWGLAHGEVTPPIETRSERIAVVGSGPAGLACAYHLARLGYRVTVLEAEATLGGMLRHGIPPYRLPRAVLDREIEMVLALGITVETGRRVTAGTWEALDAWDAVFLATGAGVPIRLDVPGAAARGVLDGLDFLRRVSLGARPPLGRRVAVVGGGSTAMDVARTARRLGVASVTVLALEARDAMPAIPDEVTQAMAEGIDVLNGVGVRAFRQSRGSLGSVEIAPAHLGRDADGRIVPVFEARSGGAIDADTVILAIGQRIDTAAIPSHVLGSGDAGVGDIVVVATDGATASPRVFAGGDVAARERTVSHAIGSGTRAARAIHAMLSGVTRGRFSDPPPWTAPRPEQIVSPARIVPHAFLASPRAERTERPAPARVTSFVEVVDGLAEPAAHAETTRCFTCGHCVVCDTCFAVCPDMAIRRANGMRTGTVVDVNAGDAGDRDVSAPRASASPRRVDAAAPRSAGAPADDARVGYVLDAQHCKGCGLCARECPRGALLMEDER